MKRIHLVFILIIMSQFVYSQAYTLKGLKVNGKVKKITHSVYGSNVASDHLDSLYLYNQNFQFFNEMGFLTIDSFVAYPDKYCKKEIYLYDSLNQLIEIVTYDKGVKDKKFRKSEVKEYKYDQNGNVIYESHSSDYGGTSIFKSFYNQENKITLWQSYYISNETKRKNVKPKYTIIEYEPKKILNKFYFSDSTLNSMWIYEYENEKKSKNYHYFKSKDSLELIEKTEFYYEDSTKIKITTWRKMNEDFSLKEEYIKYFDTNQRLIKEEHYVNGEIATLDEYFYDELGNCIKQATHYIFSEPDHPEFMYNIYKYEFY
ncbi:MAG: hypothetical protein H6Q25_1422 [Bacteroidetes bacterium]|nr:hypothetical protein [Bacteroidota bacterium]